MKFRVRKSKEKLMIVLPDEAAAKLRWARGDVLAAEVIDGRLQIMRSQTFHDRAMEIARRGMAKYRKSLEVLAKT
jgi:bifunctional DNA-binding transcriptional regulator/antitoxin component of YhaV-PrlF toxin-antitoxin module